MGSTLFKLTNKEKSLVETFIQALCFVHERHSSLFEDDVNERNVCSHIMSEIEHIMSDKWFANYWVDNEYNRMLGGGPKMIRNERTGEDIIVIPDLVIHGRGRIDEHENLLCVEVKKSSAPTHEKEDDLMRLAFLTKRKLNYRNRDNYVYGYYVGIYYEYDSHNSRSKLKIFKYGHPIQTFMCYFNDLPNLIEEIKFF